MNIFDCIVVQDFNGCKEIVNQDKAILFTKMGDWSPLHFAVAHERINFVDFLIKEGSNVNGETKATTPLASAVCADNLKIVQMLISAGADVNKKSKAGGYYPLHNAVVQNNPKTTELLLRSSADWDKVDREGLTPLLLAKKLNHQIVENVLLDWINNNPNGLAGRTSISQECAKQIQTIGI